jgi:5-formyltetrahydrofolate cyclo-ligase
MTKKELRKIFLEKRRSISNEDLVSLSQRICDHFFDSIDLSKAKIVHSFIPIEKYREPDTWLILKKIRKEFPGISIALPRANTETNTIESFLFSEATLLKFNAWSIPEPYTGVEIKPFEIDVVLVPLLTYDRSGNRVGYGKGFYDKFLNECRAETLRIGISMFEGVDKIDDIDTFDQPLHYCVTPAGAIKF